jgi:hypothetical protein
VAIRGWFASVSQNLVQETVMGRVPGIEIVRRAYKIWEDSGRPEGKDQEFYHRAERELEEEMAQQEAKQSDKA